MDYHNECGAMFYKTDQPISAQNSLKTRATGNKKHSKYRIAVPRY